MEKTEPKATADRARVLVVEDHPVASEGLQMLINNQSDLCVCGTAESVDEAVTSVRQLKPDVAVIDISLGDGNGLDLIKHLHKDHPDLPLLTLSMHEEMVYAERALRAGARGYIMKREATEKVINAIRRVLAGDIFVSDRMASRIVEQAITRPASSMDSLTDREFEVFRLLASGIGPTEIGKRLELSVKTVETHRGNIKEKLGLKNAAAMSRFLATWAERHL